MLLYFPSLVSFVSIPFLQFLCFTFLFMFVSCFNFFYSNFVYFHFFLNLCVYLFIQFLFSFPKNILVFLISFIIKIIFCLIRCRFEVWKKKTNLICFSSMVFFFSFFCSLFCFLFLSLIFNFLLRLFYCISLFCFMFKCLQKVSNC